MKTYNSFRADSIKESRLVGVDVLKWLWPFGSDKASAETGSVKEKVAAIKKAAEDPGVFDSIAVFLNGLGNGLGKVFEESAVVIGLAGNLLEKGVSIIDKTFTVAEKGYDKFVDWWEDPGALNHATGLYADMQSTPVVTENGDVQNALKMYNATLHLQRKKEMLKVFYKDALAQLDNVKHELTRRAAAQMAAKAEIGRIRGRIHLVEPMANNSKLHPDDRIRHKTELARLNSKLRVLIQLDDPDMMVSPPGYVKAKHPLSGVEIDRFKVGDGAKVKVNLKHYAEELLVHTLQLKRDLEEINVEQKKTVYWREFHLAHAYYPGKFAYDKAPIHESDEAKEARLTRDAEEAINRKKWQALFETHSKTVEDNYKTDIPPVVNTPGSYRPITVLDKKSLAEKIRKDNSGKFGEEHLSFFK